MNLQKKYDIYYRAYVKAEENAPGKWLGWAKNDQVSGVKGYDCGIKSNPVPAGRERY